MKNKSLRFRLILILSIASLCLWAVSTTIAWHQVRKEVNEVFDAQQILFAKRLATSDLRTILINHHRTKMYYGRYRKLPKRIDNDALAFAIFTPSGRLLLSDGENGENFIYAPVKGFSKALLSNGDRDMWRIFWLPTADGRLMIAVGQEIEYRDQLINEMVFGQMWVWIAGLPFLLLLIIFIVNKELSGLKAVSRELALRSPEENTPLKSENIPTEILPLVNSLNTFFNRTSSMLLRERRFTSDAAHELRSPLTALRIQTEVAQIAGDDVAMRELALQNLTQGIERASQLIEQLLTLSRLDSLVELDNLEKIKWHQLIESLIGELYFHAQKRNIELSFDHLGKAAEFEGQPLLLSLMLRNIVDNAIRYCREDTTVQIKLYADHLVIEDNGGGVSEEDLAKLGQRFYRPAGQNEKGSGLGLSIVYRIAELHHLKVRLENGKNSANEIVGLKVVIQF